MCLAVQHVCAQPLAVVQGCSSQGTQGSCPLQRLFCIWVELMWRLQSDVLPACLYRRDYIVWADSKGKWHCFLDRCPHRLATLSDGFIDKQKDEVGTTLMAT